MSLASWLDADLGQRIFKILGGMVDSDALPQIRDAQDALALLKQYLNDDLPADQKAIIDRLVKFLGLEDKLDELKALVNTVQGLPEVDSWTDLKKILKDFVGGHLGDKETAALNGILEKLGLKDELAELQQLIQATNDLPKIDDWVDGLSLVDGYLGGTLSAKQSAALDAILGKLKLTKAVDQLRKYYDKVFSNEYLAALKTRVGDFEKVEVTILAPQKKLGQINGPWRSVLNLDARGELLASLVSHKTAFAALDLQTDANHSLLALNLDASLNVKAGASLPMGMVGVKGQTSVAGKLDLDYFYQNANDQILAMALVNDLPNLPSPFNSAAVQRAGEKQLQAIYFNATGALDLGMQVNASGAWAGGFNAKVGEIEEPIGIGAQASLGYEASLALKGSFTLVVKPLGGDILSLSVTKSNSSERRSALSLDASVGITGLDKLGTKVVDRYIPEGEPLLEKLREFLNPGDLLKQKMSEQLDDFFNFGDGFEDLEAGLIENLLGDGNREDLANLLADKIQQTANQEIDLLSGDALEEGGELISRATEGWDLPFDLKEKLVAKAGEKLGGLIEKIQQGLKDKVVEIAGEQRGTLKKLLKPIEDMGEKVDRLRGDINQKAQKLLTPVIRFVQRYIDTRKKIVKGLEGMATLTIGAGFSREVNISSSAEVLLAFEVDTSVPAARDFYREMMSGFFKGALAAARKARLGSQGIQLKSGSLEQVMKRKVATGFSLQFGGIRLKRTTILSSELQVNWDASGAVNVAANGRAMKEITGYRESRSIAFTNMAQLAVKPAADTTVMFSSGVALSYNDEDLHREEVKQFFGSLEKNDIVADGTTARLVAKFNDMGAARADQARIGAEFSLMMPVTRDDMQAFTKNDRETVLNTALNQQLNTYQYLIPRRLEQLQKWVMQWPGSSTSNLYQRLREMGSKFGPRNVMDDFPANGRNLSGEARTALVGAWTIGKRALAMADYRDLLDQVLGLDLTEDNFEEKADQLNRLNKTMLKKMKPWLRNTGMIRGLFREDVPSVTLAFLLTFAQLTGRDLNSEPLVPVIKWKGQDDIMI